MARKKKIDLSLNVSDIDEKGKKFFGEFKDFINKGNVIDLAVAFVMGAAFKSVVDSIAGNGSNQAGILGGLVGSMFGGVEHDFSKVAIRLNGSDIPIGAAVTSFMNFVLIGFALFIIVKMTSRFRQETKVVSTNDLLEEIRDELRAAREANDTSK